MTVTTLRRARSGPPPLVTDPAPGQDDNETAARLEEILVWLNEAFEELQPPPDSPPAADAV